MTPEQLAQIRALIESAMNNIEINDAAGGNAPEVDQAYDALNQALDIMNGVAPAEHQARG